MIPHLAWSVISTVKTNFIIWETRDWSWKPANFSTKPLAETQWKRADTFKSTEALRKHETMPPFSPYTFPVVTVLRKRNGILNRQVSATFPNCGNSSFHPEIGPLNFTQSDLRATSDKNSNFNISKNCCVKSGFQIFYVVEQPSP